MNESSRNMNSSLSDHGNEELEFDLRRGPWTLQEDNLLIRYITCHGEGRWNKLAECAGLKRTGKSCRLRWLNYLKPDIKRGNLTPQEQLLILELHSKCGNRWSKIAQHLPGRTDNEIKNYWRTRVQKQARQLNVDSNSKKFLEAIRHYWMPRLLEKINQTNYSSSFSCSENQDFETLAPSLLPPLQLMTNSNKGSSESLKKMQIEAEIVESPKGPVQTHSVCNVYNNNSTIQEDCYHVDMRSYDLEGYISHYNNSEMSAWGSQDNISTCHEVAEADWFNDDMASGTLWNKDELWCFVKP